MDIKLQTVKIQLLTDNNCYGEKICENKINSVRLCTHVQGIWPSPIEQTLVQIMDSFKRKNIDKKIKRASGPKLAVIISAFPKW